MEISYINEPLLSINKKLFLLLFLATLGVAFVLLEFPIYFLGIFVVILFLIGVYNLPELGIAILVNGLGLIGYFGRNLELSGLIIPSLVVLYIPALIHYVLNHKLRWKFGIVPGLVLLIGVMLFAGILYSPLPSQGLVKAGKYLAINIFIFFATMLFINDLNRLKNILKIIALFGIVTTVISIVYVTHEGVESITRFTIPAHNPIWFARGLGISILATLFLFELSIKKFNKFVYMSLMLIMLFLIYISASRGPFLALIISLFIYFFIFQRKGFSFFKKVFFICMILFTFKLFIAIAPEHIWTRMLDPFSRFDLSTLYRFQAFETTKNLFLENPLKGVGTAGFGYFSVLSYPHNIVLELASEIGIWGGLVFISLVFFTVYLGIKLLKYKKSSFLELNLNRTFFTLFILVLINSQFSGAIYGNYELWFAIAGIWTLYCSQSKGLKVR